MAAAAQEPKADTRAAFNVNTDDEFPLEHIPGNHRRRGFELEGGPYYSPVFMRVLSERNRLVVLGNTVDERSLGRPDMKNTHAFMFIPFFLSVICGGSPGPRKLDVQLERVIAAFDNRKLIPKHIKENLAIEGNLAAAFTKERVEICSTRWLCPFASSPTNPGGVAELETSLLLDSGASIHAVGDVRLLTDIVFFSIDMWAACADGSHLRIVGTGTLQTDRFSIPKVHLVDGLKKNLISVSQLDKDHGLCCCFHSKKCEVILADGNVVGGAILQDDGVYELYFLEVPAEPEE